MINEGIAKKIASFTLLSFLALSLLSFGAIHDCLCNEWTVEILSVETGLVIGPSWLPSDKFWKKETVGFKLTVTNRDSVSHQAEIAVALYDAENVLVGSNNTVVSIPAGATVEEILNITIPTWVHSGVATGFADAFRVPEGTSWCPGKTVNFWILPKVEIVFVESGKGEGAAWMPCDEFCKTETVSFKLTVLNRDSVSHEAKLMVTVQDVESVAIGSNETLVSISAGATIEEYLSITIPKWAFLGVAKCLAIAIKVPEGTVWCERVTDTFEIVLRYILTVRTLIVGGTAEITAVQFRIGCEEYYSPITIGLSPGTHTVDVPSMFFRIEWSSGRFYKYEFKRWNDGSKASPKTIDLKDHTELTAYYYKIVTGIIVN